MDEIINKIGEKISLIPEKMILEVSYFNIHKDKSTFLNNISKLNEIRDKLSGIIGDLAYVKTISTEFKLHKKNENGGK